MLIFKRTFLKAETLKWAKDKYNHNASFFHFITPYTGFLTLISK